MEGCSHSGMANSMARGERVLELEVQVPGLALPWLNEGLLNQNLFMSQPECTNVVDSLWYDGPVELCPELENHSAPAKLCAFESGEVCSFQPIPSPVTTEAPSPLLNVRNKCNSDATEASSKISHVESPTSLQGQTVSNESTAYFSHSQEAYIMGNDVHGILDSTKGQYDCPFWFSSGMEDPISFDGASTDDVRRILQSSDCDLFPRICEYWSHYHQFLRGMEVKVNQILNDRGVKIKRRKRMGPEVPAIEKKEIRAQRNRERSQALRKHNKQRLGSLERAVEKLRSYNSATRSLVNTVLEHEAALPLLQSYFTENECSENLLAFLSNGR